MLTLAAAVAVEARSPEGLRHFSGAAQGSSAAFDGSGVAQGFSPAFDAALPAACAIELIHTYSLIHDDLPAMDDDTLRRVRPTLHVVYGDGIAILAGDGLHAEAFALLAREPASDDPDLDHRKLRVIGIVGEAAGAAGMVGGQAIDLQAAGQAPRHAITLDADGQHDPADVPKFLDAARRQPEALVLGRPIFGPDSPRARRYGRRLSQAFVWAVTGSFAIEDPLCGFRCFPLRRTVPLLDAVSLGDRMEFDPEIVVRLAWDGVPIVNVPTRVRYFTGGLSNFRIVRDNALIVRAYARLVLARLLGRRR
jgi:hypothetical protein